jgi:STE24 endopeptidase
VDVGHDRNEHGRPTLSLALGAVAAAALWAVAVILLLRTEVPDLALADLRADAFFPAEELERIESFRDGGRWLWAGSAATELAVLALLAWSARPLARRVGRFTRGRIRTGVALSFLCAVAVWLATLPLAAVAHRRARRFGLSEQGYPGWLGDQAVSLAVTAVLVALAIAGAVYLARRFGARWWIPGGVALALLGVLVVLVRPLAVEPLLNRFTPLPDRALAAEIERLGERLGVQVEEVEVADASRRTTTANAYVTGLGPTRRVVLEDTLLDGRFGRAEVLSVSAHELAHVARDHVWKAVAWFGLIAVPGLALLAWTAARRGGLADPALVPLALLCAYVFFLATLPAQNAISRRYEAEADWLALTATHDPDALVGLQRRLVLANLSDPDPPAWSRILLGSHPPPLRRIAMAEAFRTAAGP